MKGVCLMDLARFLSVVQDAEMTGRFAAAVKVFEDAGFGITHMPEPADIYFVNTTPHPVCVLGKGMRIVLSVSAASDPLRLEEEIGLAGYLGGIPVVTKRLKGAGEEVKRQLLRHDLQGFFYIVPLVVAQAVSYYRFLIPDCLVRDSEDRVIGCYRFAVWGGGDEGCYTPCFSSRGR